MVCNLLGASIKIAEISNIQKKGVSVKQGRMFTRRKVQFEPREEKLDEVKLYICQILRQVALRQGWTQREFAWYLRTSPSCVSLVVRGHVHRLTLNQLFHYLVMAQPHFQLLISL